MRWIITLLLFLLAAGGVAAYLTYGEKPPPAEGYAGEKPPPPPVKEPPDPDKYETVEKTEYRAPPPARDEVLADDHLEDKKPAFDPARAERRPAGNWLVNASAAVIRLDVPMVLPDREGHLLTLYPSYAAAVKGRANVLPSVNLLDGKAKQFDDGLYAALDQAYYRGRLGRLQDHVRLVRRVLDKAGPDSPAAPYLAAGLELAGVSVDVTDRKARDTLLAEFRADQTQSKPIGFYTWNDTLSECFRFLRFFQRQFPADQLAVPAAMARVLRQDPDLRADYRKAVGFYDRLTNPSVCLSVADLADRPAADAEQFNRLCKERKVFHPTVAFFPPSTSPEGLLFERLFPLGLPDNANLMREFIRRIRSGEVDLKPGPESGWYDHQVYALETLLLPEKAAERDRLLLTRVYKKRMLEAFQALVTKRKETHARQLDLPRPTAEARDEPREPPLVLAPRLRVEPCPSYFLRTARAYAFLFTFLESAVGRDGLRKLHGLKHGGQRPADLATELEGMRDLFYGLYLVSADDIGLKPEFAAGEPVDRERCYRQAEGWLARVFADEDLAADTRVAVPVYVDPVHRETHLWATLGVRLAKLDASYARPPHIRRAGGAGTWQPLAAPHYVTTAHFLIPVDEFATVKLPGARVLTREELRAVCDRAKTRPAILEALQGE
jgi:hypothetical protein